LILSDAQRSFIKLDTYEFQYMKLTYFVLTN